MIGYRPATIARPSYLGQATNLPAPTPVFTGHEGAAGIAETVAVLGVLGAATWLGIRTGLEKKEKDVIRGAGWVAGIGAALLGLMYLGAKSGLGQEISLPGMSVYPA